MKNKLYILLLIVLTMFMSGCKIIEDIATKDYLQLDLSKGNRVLELKEDAKSDSVICYFAVNDGVVTQYENNIEEPTATYTVDGKKVTVVNSEIEYQFELENEKYLIIPGIEDGRYYFDGLTTIIKQTDKTYKTVTYVVYNIADDVVLQTQEKRYPAGKSVYYSLPEIEDFNYKDEAISYHMPDVNITISFGYDDHKHDYGKGVVTLKPTCSEVGVKLFTCSICGDSYEEYIATTDHKFGKATVTRKATCSEEGETKRVCSICGLESCEAIPAIAHSYDKGVVVTEPTCQQAGVRKLTCKVCGFETTVEIPVIDHKLGAATVIEQPTCFKEGKQERRCSMCETVVEEAIAKTKHKWDDGEIKKEATCSEAGEKEFHCTNEGCTETKTEEIKKLEHNYGEAVETKAATCSEDGEKVATCKDCGVEKKSVIVHSGHKWDKGTVTKQPTTEQEGEKEFHCTNDGCTETKIEKIAKLEVQKEEGEQ